MKILLSSHTMADFPKSSLNSGSLIFLRIAEKSQPFSKNLVSLSGRALLLKLKISEQN